MQSPPSLVTPPGLPSELKMLEREIFQHIGSLFWSSPIHTSPPSVCSGAAWGWVHDGEAGNARLCICTLVPGQAGG